MPKYFMRGSRLEWLERMMMDSTRSVSGDEESQEQVQKKTARPRQNAKEESV